MNDTQFEEVLQHYQQTKYSPRRETLRKRVEDAYPILKTKAGNRDLIAYSDLATQIGTDERRYLSVVLGSITRMESKASRPPLSAVAVQKNEQIPNDVFFELIESLGYSLRGTTKRTIFENLRDDLQREWE